MLVSVDFDGTITLSSDPTSPGFNKIRPMCKAIIRTLHDRGVDFKLLTGRKEEWIPEAVRLCEIWGLPIDTTTPNKKVISDFYIDDKNIDCLDLDWLRIYDIINNELERRSNE